MLIFITLLQVNKLYISSEVVCSWRIVRRLRQPDKTSTPVPLCKT